MIYDKRAAINVLSCLMKKPSLFVNTDKYLFDKEDFEPNRLHLIIFSSIYNLFQNGAEKITINDLHAYLQKYPELYNTFNDQKGTDVILSAEENAELSNFEFYYDRLRKLSLLRTIKAKGYSIEPWYVEGEYDIQQRQVLEKKLETATLQEIVTSYQGELFEIASKFINKKSFSYSKASDGIDELIAALKIVPEIGMPLQGKLFTTVSRGARKSKFYLCSGRSGAGKALPNDTKIPTTKGWKLVGEIKVGDFLFDRKGKPTKVLKILPQGEQEVYELTFSDGRKALCNDEHLWSFWTKRKDNLKTLSVRQILDNGGLKNKKDWKYKIPIANPIEYSHKELKIDPYIFGLILGDGSFRQQHTSPNFTFSSEDEELPKGIAEIMNWTYKKNSEHNFNWTFRDFKNRKIYVTDILKDYMGLFNAYSEDKYIPDDFLQGSIEQRFELLNGLLDTDGSVDKKGRVKLYTISQKLKDDIVELTRSLGFIPTVNEDRRKNKYPKTGVCYTIVLQGNVKLKEKLFKLSRKRKIMEEYCKLDIRREHKNYIDLIDIKKQNKTTNMTCFVVDNKEHLFLTNDFIVTHNSRHAVGNAAYLAYPIRWSNKCNNWVNEGSNQKVLFITTELTEDEVQTIILANITNINEEKILNGKYNPAEEQRIEEAKKIIHEFKDNFHLYHMPDPSIEQLNSNVRRLVIGQKIQHLFFDYIHTSPALLAEFAGAKVREDVALMLLSTALKNLANELNIFVWSGTQLNANAIDLDFVDESGIRGSRAVMDKADFACALQLATKEKLKTISNLLKTGDIRPNMYYDIFKNRRGRYKRVRLWIEGDLGTARFTDLFLTDEFGNELPIDLLYAVDKNAKCDITEILTQTTETTKINNLKPTKIDMNNITL